MSRPNCRRRFSFRLLRRASICLSPNDTLAVSQEVVILSLAGIESQLPLAVVVVVVAAVVVVVRGANDPGGRQNRGAILLVLVNQ